MLSEDNSESKVCHSMPKSCKRSSENKSPHTQKNPSLQVIIYRVKLHMEKRQGELSDDTHYIQWGNIITDLSVDFQIYMQCYMPHAQQEPMS